MRNPERDNALKKFNNEVRMLVKTGSSTVTFDCGHSHFIQMPKSKIQMNSTSKNRAIKAKYKESLHFFPKFFLIGQDKGNNVDK